MSPSMRLFVGTSGFAYKPWQGSFYPEGLGEKAMLEWYAREFSAVEINSTFYRFPTVASLGAWASRVPADFQFALKVPQRITHIKQLLDVDEEIGYLIGTIASLGGRCGPLLFQLPPQMHLHLERLENLVSLLPPPVRVAFEFRHQSWFCEEVYALLERNGCALCFNDKTRDAPLHATADWGYLRLRREQYTEQELHATAERVLAQPWQSAYVFFKHEAPDSPLLARRWAHIAAELQNGR